MGVGVRCVGIDKVLAIDDDMILLRGYRLGFGRSCEVLTATTAAHGLRLAEHEQPKLIVVDLRIGRDWGVDLIRLLRLRAPHTTIVLVSGFVSVATAVAAMRAGADHVLAKPTSPEAILREVANAALQDGAQDAFPSLARAEWEHMMRALHECDGNVSETARRLRIPRQSLQRRLRKVPPTV